MIEKLEKGLATLGLDFDDAQKNKIEVYEINVRILKYFVSNKPKICYNDTMHY